MIRHPRTMKFSKSLREMIDFSVDGSNPSFLRNLNTCSVSLLWRADLERRKRNYVTSASSIRKLILLHVTYYMHLFEQEGG